MQMQKIFALLAAFLPLIALGQATKIDPTTLLKASSSNSQMLITNGSGSVVWANASTLLTGGTGISITGNTITNSNPDQTVSLSGTGITVSGSYPSFTLTAADVSNTNELQTIAAGDGSGSDKTITLSNSGGTITLAAGSGITLARTTNTITVSATATAPTISIQRFEFNVATAGTTVTVSGFTPLASDTFVFLDGVQMDVGTGEDLTISGSTLTFNFTLAVGQKVIVKKISAS